MVSHWLVILTELQLRLVYMLDLVLFYLVNNSVLDHRVKERCTISPVHNLITSRITTLERRDKETLNLGVY